MIEKYPEMDEPYYLRAASYNALTKQQRSLAEYKDYLYRALEDINQAIAIRQDKGDYYMVREWLLDSLSGNYEYHIDQVHISKLAAENSKMALDLGTTVDDYPDRTYAVNLINAGDVKSP